MQENKLMKIESSKVKIMGILNVTPDSFSDGGKYFSVNSAVSHALFLEKSGADMLDVGGVSTRPGSSMVDTSEELNRVIPVLMALKGKLKIPISVDTFNPDVASKCLELGVSIINDITGLTNPKMVEVVKKYNCGVVIMHMKGNPKTMQDNPSYNDLIGEISDFFKRQIKIANENNIKNLILDPGIGFGKTVTHNIDILNNLNKFKVFNKPILVGVSRKSFIGKEDRLTGTIKYNTIAIKNGANIIRVHDVKECKNGVKNEIN